MLFFFSFLISDLRIFFSREINNRLYLFIITLYNWEKKKWHNAFFFTYATLAAVRVALIHSKEILTKEMNETFKIRIISSSIIVSPNLSKGYNASFIRDVVP